MAIIEIIIIVGIYTYILLRMPQLRLAGGIVAAALLGGLSYYFLSSDPEPQPELRRVDVSEITLSDLELDLGIRTSSLSGRVVNGAANYSLKGLLLDVTLYDCPNAESPLSDCFIIGQDDGEARVAVPPLQLRDFSVNLLFTGLPEITGELRWVHQLTNVRALENP